MAWNIYLAGPMRGKANFNFPAFDFAAQKLRAEGHEVFSPADNDRKMGVPKEENPTGDESIVAAKTGLTARDFFDADTHYICRGANAVALLPGWENSQGACAERLLGIALGHTIIVLGKDYVQ